MLNKDLPRVDGISFGLPNPYQSFRIDESLKKIIRKAGEISEDFGIEKEEIYKKINFSPEGFVDEYSRNFDDYENFLPPEEYSDLVVKELEDLKKEFNDPEPNNELTYGKKIKRFLKGKGKVIAVTGLLLGSVILGGCLSEVGRGQGELNQKGQMYLDDSTKENFTENLEPILNDAFSSVVNNIITVDDEPGDAMFTKIQEAVDYAKSGDTIEVYGGEYKENVRVYKPLILKGVEDKKEHQQLPVIDAQGNDSAIILEADSCVVDGFKLMKAPVTPPGSGILCGGVKITSNNNVLKDNIILMNGFAGIYLTEKSENNQIFKNNITQNSEWGIWLSYGSKNNSIYENMLSNNGGGIRVEDKNKIYKNKIFSSSIGVFMVVGNIGVKDAKISENIFLDNSIGLEMDDSRNNLVLKNTFENNKIGIKLYRSENNHINYNNFIKNNLHATFECVLAVSGWNLQEHNNYPKDCPIGLNNDWEENYWNRARIFPKPILGRGWIYPYYGSPRSRIVLNFDLHPLKEPYEET